jgi:pyrroline-5-carboxylate reductase
MAAKYTVGVIGVGQMGGALVRGMVRGRVLAPEQIIVADVDSAKAAGMAQELGVKAAAGNRQVAEESEFVFLVVKPGLAAGVVKEIADAVSGDCTLVSLVTGVPIARLRDALGRSDGAVIRVMPNTPVLVGAGAFALAAPGAAAERVEALKRLLDPLGRVVVVGEELMDAVTGMSGSGPAFVFVMIEAMADGGVAAGLPRAIAQELAAQTVMGAAKMVLETGDHPAALKDAVASPGGTTIAGLSELEKGGFRAAVVSAVKAAARRARELSES